tara:strand:- start:1745 stop:2335 length:591 start_codon:yes stop_codon:yes gene_type:complete
MMLKKNEIKLCGKIEFDPPDITNKHCEQSSWKKVAMITLEPYDRAKGGICDYYSWFLKKRFNISLLRPVRGAHITFINDHIKDINENWESVKKRWHSKSVDVVLNVEPKTDSSSEKESTITHNWWLNVPQEHRVDIQKIRDELGLGLPFFSLHMTIGRAENFKKYSTDNSMKAKEMNVEQSIYIHNSIRNKHIRFD